MQKPFSVSSALLVSMLVWGCGQPTPKSLKDDVNTPTFKNVSGEVGLNTVATWKYGGPVIADLNNDDRYDLVLINHHEEPAQLWWSQPDNTYRLDSTPIATGDVHGIAAGDYDLDGDNDLLISLGGGNGSTPQPPRLKQNSNGQFTDITGQVGIDEMGARGRSVRWVDIDRDGDLDMLQITAVQVIKNTGPRNILFENTGDGQFVYRKSPIFEKIEAERVLITDFNGDDLPDLITFTPLSVLAGTGNFVFNDVSKQVLPQQVHELSSVTAVTDADIDNDGDLDLYLSRGKTYYEIANNSISYDAKMQRLDLRDEGNKGHDGISFEANNEITLSDFYHWPRGVELTLPVFLGNSKLPLETPSSDGITISAEQAKGFPSKITENGWYLGYMDNNQWRLEWHLNGDLAWDLRASITGINKVLPDWTPQNRNLPDVLLENNNGIFTDISARLPKETDDNNWGVITADFNNDQFADFFVYRFGDLTQRKTDLLLMNNQQGGFNALDSHGANVLGAGGHGDMGAALDYDKDGFVDILSGDDNPGKWYLYENQLTANAQNHYLTITVGYSESGIDSLGAKVKLSSAKQQWQNQVGSAGAVHSQSVLNQVHFGIAELNSIDQVTVQWRDGTTQILNNVKANQHIKVGD